MSSMKHTWGERGSANALFISVILLTVLFVGSASFAFWAFGSRQDYKNNSDAKVAAAVAVANKTTQAADAKQYAEAAKNPLKIYTGPDQFGAVRVSYPKTWGAYVDTAGGSMPVDAYFHDNYVPSTDSKSTYNLRVQVVADTYSSQLGEFSSYIQQGTVKAAPYALPKVPSVVGTKLTGQINPNDNTVTNGTLILLPLRDKTLKIWTESASYANDFNTYILPNLTFSP